MEKRWTQVTTPHGSKPCRPTAIVRFIRTSQFSLKKHLVHHLARLVNTVVFLPMTKGRGTHRSALQLATCMRTICACFGKEEKTEMELRRMAARLSSFCLKAKAFRRVFVGHARVKRTEIWSWSMGYRGKHGSHFQGSILTKREFGSTHENNFCDTYRLSSARH
jgi:hypothetical protein